jgi:hypothetical protein
VVWIHLAQDFIQWREVLKTAMNLRVPLNVRNFFTSWATISFSRSILFHLVTCVVQSGDWGRYDCWETRGRSGRRIFPWCKIPGGAEKNLRVEYQTRHATWDSFEARINRPQNAAATRRRHHEAQLTRSCPRWLTEAPSVRHLTTRVLD